MNALVGNGVDLCKKLYAELASVGVFPALTGGVLYKDGPRKDIDIVLFRHRQDVINFETEELEEGLRSVGLSDFEYYGFVTKCKYGDLSVDLFNPETQAEFDDESYGE